MTRYYMDKTRTARSGWRYEVHKKNCKMMSDEVMFVGNHLHCHAALAEARRFFPDADGCKDCSPLCCHNVVHALDRDERRRWGR